MRILMVTAEYTPLAKTGGLADMVAGLSTELANSGHDVRILIPRYRGVEAAGEPLSSLQLPPFATAISPVALNATHPPYELIRRSTGSGPEIWQLDAPGFFAGSTIYGGGDTEALRFALLSHAALKLWAALCVLAVLFFSVVNGDYMITADASLEGTVQRAVTVSLQGYIMDARARAGDIVRSGDVLATLDDRDLRLERLKLVSQGTQQESERRQA
ncbi:MAG: glycogen/starch synthase, partial [Deltaproteobacteria bacterium]|nr:glycogen/starch synthase [Deltaproteobacteria bacterium]